MKKILITLSIAIFSLASIAQEGIDTTEDTGAKNNMTLPKAGDIGVGFDASPFLNYVGNMFNGTTNNRLNLNDNTLYFRYFLTGNSAIRASINLSTYIDILKEYVPDDAAIFLDPNSNKQLVDRRIDNWHSYEMKVGYQLYHNHKNFRGFYGADLGYHFEKYSRVYEYGNQMTEINSSPTTYWHGNTAVRPLEQKAGIQNSISLGAFIGGEYYFMPRVCVGAEFGLAYGMTFEGQGYETQERMVGTLHVEENIARNPGSMNISMQTQFPYSYGNLYLMFHF